jgi:RNA polymerase sigma-70 factor (ECF subfamily)
MTRRAGTDAELVARTCQGDTQAFDGLVLRHRARLYDLARRITGRAEAAEDVVQEALLRAYRSLPSLREGDRFGPWLTTIVRREAIRWLREGRRRSAGELDTVSVLAGGLAAPSETPAEVTALVSQALQALSARHRQAMVLHYLEGRTCQEIAARFGVSEGRIKRLLYDSRQAARKECTAMTAPDKKGPRTLSSWLSGNVPYGPTDPHAYLNDSLLAQSICLSVNKRARSAPEIAAQVEAHLAYVEGTIDHLVELEVLVSPRKGRYLLNFLALDAEDWRQLAARMRQPAGELAQRITEAQPRLVAAFARTPLAAAGWEWEDVTWVINALFLANRALLGVAGDSPETVPPPRPGDSAYWIGGYESGPDVPFMDAPGYYGTDRGGWGLGHFGPGMAHAHYSRPFDPPAYGQLVLHALLEGPRTEDEIVSQASTLDRERCRSTLAELAAAGLVAREEERFHLTFPVFTSADGVHLAPVIEDIVTPLSAEVLAPTWSDVGALLDDMGYHHRREQYPVWRAWLSGFVAGEALRFMVKQGTLPALGDPPPAKWSYSAWLGNPPWEPPHA